MDHSLSLPTYFEGTIEEANTLRVPDPSKAIVKFRAELSQCEAKLSRVSGEKKSLRLLCSKKKEELKDLRVELAKARKNESEIDEQAKKIKELETELARARAEAVQAKAEAEKTKAATDKAIAEIAEAKAQKTDARFLVSSDDEDVVSGSRDGEGEEDVIEGEEAPEDRATEGVVPEDDTPRGVTPKID
ncbi:protein gar2-like [Nicotiana sylvestris]|uniref:protein gar2-like n=1 Tax=Nicotiana sylvestris TaxID=4096 RepID=UPI00388C90D0